MDSVLLKAQELSYSYHTLNGETPALDRVSFCLYRKEFLAIVGSQRLRQIHDFVPDRRLAHPGQRRHHVLWGKWSSARHRLHAAARSFI